VVEQNPNSSRRAASQEPSLLKADGKQLGKGKGKGKGLAKSQNPRQGKSLRKAKTPHKEI